MLLARAFEHGLIRVHPVLGCGIVVAVVLHSRELADSRLVLRTRSVALVIEDHGAAATPGQVVLVVDFLDNTCRTHRVVALKHARHDLLSALELAGQAW